MATMTWSQQVFAVEAPYAMPWEAIVAFERIAAACVAPFEVFVGAPWLADACIVVPSSLDIAVGSFATCHRQLVACEEASCTGQAFDTQFGGTAA